MQRHKDIIKAVLHTQSFSFCCYHVMHELELSLKTKIMAEPNRHFKTWKINRSFSKIMLRFCIAVLGPSFSQIKYSSQTISFQNLHVCSLCLFRMNKYFHHWGLKCFRNQLLGIFSCPSGAGHSCGNPAAGHSANWKTTAGSGHSSVEVIACNNLTKSELMLNRYSWQYFQSMIICC